MKKMAMWTGVGLVLFAIVAAGTFVGNLVFREYAKNSFGRYVCDYSHRVTHNAAYAAFRLADKQLGEWEKEAVAKRLAKLENDYRHPYRAAMRNFFDNEFPENVTDSYRDILTDISFALGREKSPGSEVWSLCETQDDIFGIAWPYMCEGFHNPDGSVSGVDYREYLVLREKFKPLEKKMDGLLAQYAAN